MLTIGRLSAVVWALLYKTKLGMHIRCVGENPDAAESVGISTRKVKIVALAISGVLASLGRRWSIL